MAEAEDVITDAARHATQFAQALWRRHRPADRETIDLPALLHRLDLFLTAAFEESFPLRIAQPPAPIPFVRRVFRRQEAVVAPSVALPATDGVSLWLPIVTGADPAALTDDLQLIAMHQAQRARRGSTRMLSVTVRPLERAIYEVLEALAAEHDLAVRFGGLSARLSHWRERALAARPPLQRFPDSGRGLEAWLRDAISTPRECLHRCDIPEASLQHARTLAAKIESSSPNTALLLRDAWIGELRVAPETKPNPSVTIAATDTSVVSPRSPRSARLSRRPQLRNPDQRDEHTRQGAWMVQTAQPHEHAEDPFGMQRPTDRDESTAADDFADSVAEMHEARLVATPDAPKEVLLSDDPPDAKARAVSDRVSAGSTLAYPEWDWRQRSYRDPGAYVHVLDAPRGPPEWITRTLEKHRVMVQKICRQFESLQARRTRLRQQTDGEELDIEACVDAFADARAGAALRPGLYQITRNARRDMAVLLLIDVSGSTDSWVSANRRIIDVEREALLLVCLALERVNEPYSVLAFSGEGPAGVTIRSIKSFAEPYGSEIAERIAGLEPERYTRAGAAIRHAAALLMREAAHHRLLLILSDGKPNDMDEYDGRYGVEDMRQSVTEARLQGIFTFCLTIDRHSAHYLPAIFGEHQYSVLHTPEMLPTALLGWLRRLIHG